MRAAIVLFARSPEREAAAKRMASAAPLFRSLAAAWLRESARCGATPLVACSERDRAALGAIAPVVARGWIEQGSGAFGERVADAVDEAFARGFDAVLVAAIDAPPRELDRALKALAEGKAVVSPSRDGGVNFVGLRAPHRELLTQLTPGRRDLVRVCQQLLDKIEFVGGTIDLDSNDALAIAKRDRAWRAFLPTIEARTREPITCALTSTYTPRSPRPPPA